jgi:hypothetical protein
MVGGKRDPEAIDPARKEWDGFPPFRQKKGERMGHGMSVFAGRINKAMIRERFDNRLFHFGAR